MSGAFLCLWASGDGRSAAVELARVSFDDIIRAMPSVQMKPGEDRRAPPNWWGHLADGTKLFITGPKEAPWPGVQLPSSTPRTDSREKGRARRRPNDGGGQRDDWALLRTTMLMRPMGAHYELGQIFNQPLARRLL